ncbi:MAG: 4-aminobutyrate--2-oxoglutarate transaminase [Candidatus Bipolaricaulia bacterium]
MNTTLQTERSGPKTDELLRKKVAYVSDAIPTSPMVISRGEGALIWDVDGNRYIDFTGGVSALNVGHAHPRIVAAIQEQVKRYIHTDFSIIAYEPYIALAQRLTALAPGPTPKKAVFFNSGAEAVENAVKFARAYTGRPAIAVFEGAFHGRTLLTLTMTHKGKPYKSGFGPLAAEVYRLPFPDPYHNPIPFDQVERALVRQVDPRTVATVVVEPIQGEGGFIVPTDGFLRFLRELTNRYGMLLIADEIQTGFGRTGKWFACEHWGVEPDLMTIGKSIAAGLPLSGVIGNQEIMDTPEPNAIGGTFIGNPVACRAAVEVLEIIEATDLLNRAEVIGQRLRERLRAMQDRYELIGEVRGVGAMVAVELVRDRQTKEPATEETEAIVTEAQDHGALFLTAGPDRNVIRFLAPLVITDDQLTEGMEILNAAIEAVV